MPIPQQLINLLNMPLGRLKQLAADAGVEVGGDLTKWAIAEQLAHLPEETLLRLAGDWLYAGSTSVTWNQLGEGEPIPRDEWYAAVNEVLGADVEAEDIRPDEVTNRPKLVEMRDLSDGKLACTFAVTKRVTKVIHNFELEDVYADEFFVAIVRLERGIVEVRGSHERALRLANTWLASVADRIAA